MITTEYAENYVYEGGALQFFNTAEGYVEPKGLGWEYVFQYKDHLGNIRLSYADADGNGLIAQTEIREENNYYPFGLKHKGYNNAIGGSKDHKYGFGNKEEQDELGLGWIDITARNYDPALGRWMNLDPLAEQMRRFSPYNYAWDNPINVIDPDGLFGIFINENGEKIGDDGIDDKKVYVIKTTKESFKAFNSDTEAEQIVNADGITEAQKNSATEFVSTNSGKTDEFKNNQGIYDNFVELPSSEIREEIKNTVAGDDGKGGSSDGNNREYAGQVRAERDYNNNPTGELKNIPSTPGSVVKQGNGFTTGVETKIDVRTVFTYHSHLSGTNAGNAVQFPSVQDYRNATGKSGQSTNNIVIGKGDNTVYIYSTNGVKATLPLKAF